MGNKLIKVDVPHFKHFRKRIDLQNNISETLTKVCAKEEGALKMLVLHGESGTGKTTLVSYMIHSKACLPMWKQCGIDVVLWLDCFQWKDRFDEEDLTREIIKLANQVDPKTNDLQRIGEVHDFFQLNNQKVLLVLDNFLNITIVQKIEIICPWFITFIITTDISYLKKESHLPFETIQLLPADDDEIANMLKDTFSLKEKLDNVQIQALAKKCCGLPVIASLVAAPFRSCETKEESLAQYGTMEEIVSRPLKGHRHSLVYELFEFNINRLRPEEKRELYYRLLLFDPNQPVEPADLAILWGIDYKVAVNDCVIYCQHNLLRRSNQGEHGNCYVVHPILFDTCVINAKIHKFGQNLSEIRTKIVTEFTGDCSKLLELLVRAIENKRRHVIEVIFEKCDEQLLARVCQLPVDN